MAGFPYQQAYPNFQQPTLLPNFDKPVAVNGTMQLTTPAGVVAAYPVVASSGSAVIGGTATTGNVMTLTIANGVLTPSVTLTYTVPSGSTTSTIAYAFAQLIMQNATLGRFGFYAEANGSTLLIYQQSGVGNFSTLSASSTGTETVTLTQMSGGSGPITPVENFTFASGPNLNNYWFGIPANVNYQTLKAMVTEGVPIR